MQEQYFTTAKCKYFFIYTQCFFIPLLKPKYTEVFMKNILLLAYCVMIAFSSCNPPASQKVSGIDLNNLDPTANPVDDFYQYACGGWMKQHPLRAEYARYGSFDKLAEENVIQVNDLVQELAKQHNEAGSVADKIATLYNVGMDSLSLNRQGAEPIRPLLEEVAALTDRAAIAKLIPVLHKKGIYPFFGLFAEADFTNSKVDIAWIFQSGLGMTERDYYLDADERSKEIREKYHVLLANMFRLSGYDKLIGTTPEDLAKIVMTIETDLAKAFMSRHDLRDPYKMFNKREVGELTTIAPEFDFKTYFNTMGLSELKTLNVGQPDYIKVAGNVLAKSRIEDIKAYLAWNIIHEAASYLSDDFVNENFDFYGRVLSGMEELQPRWKRVIANVNGTLGEAVGQMYVSKYFPADSKERMINLVKNLQTSLGERIQSADWMDEQTKEKAMEKLHSFHVKIGYPDKWRDYSNLDIQNDSYFANILRSNEFEMDYMLNKIDKPKDVDEWGMTPQTVNAYYNPTTNEICFPAAILQPPFFFANADDAVNYGAIGVVIGHEMTHGFDDQGRQYDKEGNLSDWWQATDAENFKTRAQVLVDFFNGIEVAPGVTADGKYTLGENIADNGGVQISFQAMQAAKSNGEITDIMDDFTPEQRFFLAYATVWAGNIRDEEILRLTKEDSHSLARWRVNGTLPHIQAFLEAFHVESGHKMYLPADQQASIW